MARLVAWAELAEAEQQQLQGRPAGTMSAAGPAAARIVGAGMTALSKSQPYTAVQLMVQALQLAVEDTHGLLTMRDIDTVIALPSLMSDQHFMIGHAVAQEVRRKQLPSLPQAVAVGSCMQCRVSAFPMPACTMQCK